MCRYTKIVMKEKNQDMKFIPANNNAKTSTSH